MKALNGADVLALHTIALADKRLDIAARLILAEIARTGRVLDPGKLAVVVQLKGGARAAQARLDTLAACGYLPSKENKS